MMNFTLMIQSTQPRQPYQAAAQHCTILKADINIMELFSIAIRWKRAFFSLLSSRWTQFWYFWYVRCKIKWKTKFCVTGATFTHGLLGLCYFILVKKDVISLFAQITVHSFYNDVGERHFKPNINSIELRKTKYFHASVASYNVPLSKKKKTEIPQLNLENILHWRM